MKLNKRLIFTIASCAGTVITAVLAVKGGVKAGRTLEAKERQYHPFQYKVSTKEAAETTIRCCIPAAIAGAATVGCTIMSHRYSTALLAVGSTTIAYWRHLYDESRAEFDHYSNAVKKEVGEDSERDIRMAASKVIRAEDEIIGMRMECENEETKARFYIDWLGEGKEFYVSSSLIQFERAMTQINRNLIDPDAGTGHIATVSDFLSEMGHPEMCTEETDNRGWEIDILEQQCGAHWISPKLRMREDGSIRVYLNWYPNVDISEYLDKLERGDI